MGGYQLGARAAAGNCDGCGGDDDDDDDGDDDAGAAASHFGDGDIIAPPVALHDARCVGELLYTARRRRTRTSVAAGCTVSRAPGCRDDWDLERSSPHSLRAHIRNEVLANRSCPCPPCGFHVRHLMQCWRLFRRCNILHHH